MLDFAKTQDEVHLNLVRKFQKFICDPKKLRVPSEKFKAIALVDPLASWVRVGILFVEYCADQDKVGKEVFRRGDKLYSKVLLILAGTEIEQLKAPQFAFRAKCEAHEVLYLS